MVSTPLKRLISLHILRVESGVEVGLALNVDWFLVSVEHIAAVVARVCGRVEVVADGVCEFLVVVGVFCHVMVIHGLRCAWVEGNL